MLFPEDHNPARTEYERRAVRHWGDPEGKHERGLLRPLVGWVLGIALVVALVLAAPSLGRAEPAPVLFDCQSFGKLIGGVMTYREAGASLGKTLQLYHRKLNLPKQYAAIVEREIRRAWKEGQAEDDAAFTAFKRCTEHHPEVLT